MNQPPTQKNGDVDANASASSTNSTYVPPARRNQILSGNNGGGRSGGRGGDYSSSNSDERFAGYRQSNQRGGYESRGPRSGSDNMNERKSGGSSFFDRPSTSSAPRRSKWQDDEYGSREDRGRGRRQQVGPDGLLPRDTRVEEELFQNHSNTGINFDKYQVRFIPHTFRTQSTLLRHLSSPKSAQKMPTLLPYKIFGPFCGPYCHSTPIQASPISSSTLPDIFIDENHARCSHSRPENPIMLR